MRKPGQRVTGLRGGVQGSDVSPENPCLVDLGGGAGDDLSRNVRGGLVETVVVVQVRGPAVRNSFSSPALAGVFDRAGTLLSTSLLEREPVHVVSQRLGHASPMVTPTVYAHVMPGNQRETARTLAGQVREARGA
jgi:integrase